MRDIYFIRRWKKRDKIEPDVVLFLNDSATMVSNPHGIYSKQFLKYKIIQWITLTRGVCDTKWKINEKKFQWNGWMFLRKYYCMKIFLHFGIILLYNNYIEKKKLEKRSIVLKCKYCWSTNIRKPETETAKRQKGRAESAVSWKVCLTLIWVGFLVGPFWGVELFFVVFEIWYVIANTNVVSEYILLVPRPS